MANRTKFTPKAKEKFLQCLQNGDTIVQAAEKAGVSRQTPYDHMKADAKFAEQVAMSNEIGAEAHLLPVAINRARDGWEEPVFYEGAEVGTIRRFDNNLLWKLIQAKSKRYRIPTESKDLGAQLIDLAEELKAGRQRAGIA
ncbi:MAG TPA: hypothetical protein VHE12_05870 [bacterium]|nr:hypothetical protein [bacterium]